MDCADLWDLKLNMCFGGLNIFHVSPRAPPHGLRHRGANLAFDVKIVMKWLCVVHINMQSVAKSAVACADKQGSSI